MGEITGPLLLLCLLATTAANRVYVHPFSLFALDNSSCESIQAPPETQVEMVSLMPIEANGTLEPDVRIHTDTEQLRQNVTQRASVLAHLLNTLGLRLYGTLRAQNAPNTLFSPVNAYGALVTLYLGASGATAGKLQKLLGLEKKTDTVDCVSPFDGHKVLHTLQNINSLIDGATDELRTQVWVFGTTNISESFARGVQDLSDTSYTRAVDLSQPLQAQAQLNTFIQKTSEGKINNLFQDISSSSDLLFASSVHFKGNWRIAFKPEATSPQEFWIDDKTSIMVPLMTHTGNYKHLNDKTRNCMVLKLPLSGRAYMLLVLPHEGTHLGPVEDQLTAELISTWSQHLKEGVLEVSLPKFSINSVSDLKSILSDMRLPTLLGEGADFSQISRKENFTVGKVLSKVVFETSEEGAEEEDKPQAEETVVKLMVNRPFCFAIVEGNSDAILLLGRI
ncbi:hypothetical protein JZ751_011005, partial [Albula glossodonta]